MNNHAFQVVKDLVQADGCGCLRLDAAVPRKRYRVLINEIGQILLDPVASCPASELWLWDNPEHVSSVCQGIQQVAQGEVHDLGSFAEYVDLEVED
ncbi:hypothetical protein [Acaryochloris sp. IP29b_bin.148]|uniref:hypothetical protein n=1 Tax=Acaryochloris sp. IP29b_bin.148 TaxID=2969218 RepID=UPI002636D41F|nr:hypothetical protein [Acaryochloris sp. IP29b_bin.148]